MSRIKKYNNETIKEIQKALKAAKDERNVNNDQLSELLLSRVETVKNWTRKQNPTMPSMAVLFKLSLNSKAAFNILKKANVFESKKIIDEIDIIHKAKDSLGATQQPPEGIYTPKDILSLYNKLNKDRDKVLLFGLQNLIEGRSPILEGTFKSFGEQIRSMQNHVYVVPYDEDFSKSHESFTKSIYSQQELIQRIIGSLKFKNHCDYGVSDPLQIPRSIHGVNKPFYINVCQVNLSDFINKIHAEDNINRDIAFQARAVIYSLMILERAFILIDKTDEFAENAMLLETIGLTNYQGINIDSQQISRTPVKVLLYHLSNYIFSTKIKRREHE